MNSPHFVIYAPSYDDRVGGTMVLHELCDRINRLGGHASIWRYGLPARFEPRRWRKWARYFLSHSGRFSFGPYARRRARRKDLDGAIVIYPEIVDGNPLDADRVVRWLLHKPGFHTGAANFGSQDWIAYYNPAFDGPCIGREPHFQLRVTASIDAYKQVNYGPRTGSAVLFRKGRDRIHDSHPDDAIVVDGLSHDEMADVFNTVERLYSYDLHSFTTTQAAICGCIPIVVPERGLSEEEWEPRKEQRLGIAYGTGRLEWAVETRPDLIASLESDKSFEDQSVRSLIELFTIG